MKFTMRMILFYVFFFTLKIQADTVFPCSTLWSGAIPDSRYTTLNCTEATSQTARSSTIKVYHYTTGWTADYKQLQFSFEAADAFIDIEQKITAGTFPDVALFLVDQDSYTDGSDAYTFSQSPTIDGRCPVFIYQNIFKYKSPEERKQIVAHEIAHCYQRKNFPKQMSVNDNFIRWWVEGTAVYLANFVYPNVYVDNYQMSSYKPQTAINVMANPYATASFFHSISSNEDDIYSALSIIEILPKDPASKANDQINALTDDVRTTGRFHTFAEQFTNGEILDFAKHPLNTNYVSPTFVLDMSKGDSDMDNDLFPFTFKSEILRFPTGGKFTLRLKVPKLPLNIYAVSYRKRGEKKWTQFTQYSPLVIDTSCKDNAAEYEFLYSTTGMNGIKKTISISKEYKDIPCPCEDKLPLDTCLVGKWKIRNSSVDNLFAKIYSVQKDMTYLGSKGEMYFGVDALKNLSIEVPGLNVATKKDEPNSNSYTVEVDLDGLLNGKVGFPEPGKLCFKNSSGEFNGTTTITFPSGPISGNTKIPMPDGSYAVSDYVCNDKIMKIFFPLHIYGEGNPPEIIELIYDKIY
jgi:hypothetical protein